MAAYWIERKNPKTGVRETIVYTGRLANKPKGWRIVQKQV